MNKKLYRIIILCLQMNMFNICHCMHDYTEYYGNENIINTNELKDIDNIKLSYNIEEVEPPIILNIINNNTRSKRSNDLLLEENINNNFNQMPNKLYENNNCNCLKNMFNTIKSYIFCNNINTNNDLNTSKDLIISDKNCKELLKEIDNKHTQKISKNSVKKLNNSVSKNMCRKTTPTLNLIEGNHKTSVNLKSSTPSKIGIIKKTRKTSAEISNWPIFEISANCHIVNRQNKTVFVNNKEVKISKIKDDYNNLSKKHGSSFEVDKLAYNAKYKAVQNKTFCNIF